MYHFLLIDGISFFIRSLSEDVAVHDRLSHQGSVPSGRRQHEMNVWVGREGSYCIRSVKIWVLLSDQIIPSKQRVYNRMYQPAKDQREKGAHDSSLSLLT